VAKRRLGGGFPLENGLRESGPWGASVDGRRFGVEEAVLFDEGAVGAILGAASKARLVRAALDA
jgi:hypothetical protein